MGRSRLFAHFLCIYPCPWPYPPGPTEDEADWMYDEVVRHRNEELEELVLRCRYHESQGD